MKNIIKKLSLIRMAFKDVTDEGGIDISKKEIRDPRRKNQAEKDLTPVQRKQQRQLQEFHPSVANLQEEIDTDWQNKLDKKLEQANKEIGISETKHPNILRKSLIPKNPITPAEKVWHFLRHGIARVGAAADLTAYQKNRGLLRSFGDLISGTGPTIVQKKMDSEGHEVLPYAGFKEKGQRSAAILRALLKGGAAAGNMPRPRLNRGPRVPRPSASPINPPLSTNP